VQNSPYSVLPQILQPIRITRVTSEAAYNYYGSISSSAFIDEASKTLAANSDADLSEVERLLHDFVRLSRTDYLHTRAANARSEIAAWLAVRITKPTEEYTLTPRWHRDGRMYPADRKDDVNSKYATAILGNPTRMLAESDLVYTVMAKYEHGQQRFRKEMAESLFSEPLLDIRKDQIIRFTWGQVDSPVHSEPDCAGSDRIFVSILFGSETEIRKMCEFRGKKYME
jgi:hypothetical protein